MGMQFGIIGKKLSHSFSKSYFEKKFIDKKLSGYSYTNFEIASIEEFRNVLSSNKDLRGLNVTNPYKEAVIPYLDQLTNEAKEIGAVNCIKIDDGKLTGYNTDVYGFSQSIKPFLDTNHERALILGTGGASKAVAFALKRIGVQVYFVSSSNVKKVHNTFYYSELNEVILNSFKLIVNTTPLGMFPDNNSFPDIPYQYITEKHLCYDLIYNPEQTEFLRRSKLQGAIIVNGWSMLQLQAEKSWEIWST